MSEHESELQHSPSDNILILLLIAAGTLIPACVCSYFVGLSWWILALGGDDDMSFRFDGPYITAYEVNGPDATLAGRVSWPPWCLAVWLVWIVGAFLVVRLRRRRGPAATDPTGSTSQS